MSTSAPLDPPALKLFRWGLRFEDPETEARYRTWQRMKAVPFTRIGMVASVFCWLCALAGNELSVRSAWITRAVLFWMFPLIGGAFALTYSRRFLRWMHLATMLANCAAGCLAVFFTFRIFGLPQGGMGAAILVTFFAFGVFRLRPGQALISVVPYLGLADWLLFEEARAGRMTATMCLLFSQISPMVLVTGFLASAVLDHTSRQNFRQERLIELQQAALRAQTEATERERVRADQLLFSILPKQIAQRLKLGPEVIAQRFDDVTVLFADVVGFTPLAAGLPPEDLVAVLNELFTRFDGLATANGVEKIKTIGDAYMAVAGLPEPHPDPASAVADLALAMRDCLAEYRAGGAHPIEVRIGICSGPVVAGVIGARKFAYDLWGDTVNSAARMESHGVHGEIQVAETTFERLRGRYAFEERGEIEVKGKGKMRTWLLKGRLPAERLAAGSRA